MRIVHLILVSCLLAPAAAGCASRRAPTPTAPPDPLTQFGLDIASMTHSPGVRHGVWGIVVYSLDRRERLFELNPRTLLVPASAAKLVSLATAVDAVGWNYRFLTTLEMSGPIVDTTGAGSAELGVLNGDLIVRGSGDPTIAIEDLDVWIDALRARGVRRVRGRVIGDDNAIEDPRPALAWAWDDLGYRTGALFGALNVAENRLTVTVAPASDLGSPARLGVESFAAARPLSNRVTTAPRGSAPLIWPEQRPGETALTIAGAIPLDSPALSLPVSAGNPTHWFASVLRHRLIEAGIPVDGDAVDIDDVDVLPAHAAIALVHAHRSPALAEIARPLLKDSINLHGEALMRLNVPPGRVATNDAALDGLRQRLTAWGLAPDGQQLVDGSGLSRRNVLSPNTILAILVRMYELDDSSPWMAALPIAGVDGSLQTRMRGTPAEGRVRAKTGTMSNVRALAGYVTTRGGERLAFAVLVNNFEGSGADANAAIDAIAARLAAWTRTL